MKTPKKAKHAKAATTPASTPETLNQRLAARERAQLKKLEQRLPTALN